MILIGDEVQFTLSPLNSDRIYRVIHFDNQTITVKSTIVTSQYGYTLPWDKARKLGIKPHHEEVEKTAHMVRMTLYITGNVEGGSQEEATVTGKGIIQSALADTGWSSVDLEKEARDGKWPLEVNGKYTFLSAPVPFYPPASGPTCGHRSPHGNYVCILSQGHPSVHVDADSNRIRAIWDA